MDNGTNDFYNNVNHFIDKVIREYQDILMNELDHYFLNTKGDNLLNTYFTIEKYSLSDYYSIEIDKILRKINIPDMKIEANFDIKKLYDLLIEEILSAIKSILGKYNKSYIYLGLYNLATYMAEVHGRINMIFSNKFTIPSIDKMDPKEFCLLKSIEVLKDNGNNISVISAMIGTDKVIVQHIFSILPTISFENSRLVSLDSIKEIYKLTYILTRLISEKDLVTSKFMKDSFVEIKDYKINLSEQMIENIRMLNTSMLINETSVDGNYITEEILNELDKGLQKNKGFSIHTINKFIMSENKAIKDGDLSILVEKETLIRAILTDTGCSFTEAINIFTYLSREEENIIDDVTKSVDTYATRMFECPLISVDLFGKQLYLLSYTLLIYSYEILRKKLIYDLIPECSKDNSKLIQDYIKNEPVEKIKSIIESKGIMVYDNIQDFEIIIDGKKKKIHLPREIDVLWVKEHILYLVECKDILYKFTGLGFKQDIYSAIKYIDTIKKNEDEVLGEKKIYIETLFQSEVQGIKSALIYRHPNSIMNSNIDKREVDIYTLSDFENLIAKECK